MHVSRTYISLSILFLNVYAGSLPWPNFESGWLPIKNGLKHVARLNIDHGLGEVPVLVDVSVKINDRIFPASGFRPDHPLERSGPVVYIYDDQYVNVSTSPIEDPLYRLVPRVNARYEGAGTVIIGNAHVRVRAWKLSSLPDVDFKQTAIQLRANTSKVSDSYAEVHHNLNEMPCLVVVRIKMIHQNNLVMADGVGSSMQVYAGVRDRTNAYMVYGYSNTTVRMWVDSSNLGAIFDGRRHTWFDMVISEGEAEIFAWKCSSITPLYNKRVVTRYTLDTLPEWWNLDVDYELEPSLIRVSVLAETPEGPNEGFRFPGGMYLGYPEPPESGNTVSPVSVGGLSYAYQLKYKFNFWQPKFSENFSSIFIAESFGNGKNTEVSHSESVYITSWMYEENAGCPTPVIPNGFANTSLNGTSVGSHATVRCDDGFKIKEKELFYVYDYKRYDISCHRYGYWQNIPSCIPNDKDVGSDCSPAVGTCHDQHASCVLTADRSNYRCTCNAGYKNDNGRCKALGTYLPKADYDSDWKVIARGGHNWYLEFEHGLGTLPIIVDVQVEVNYNVYHAIGFSPRTSHNPYGESTVVYIYDERYVNVSSYRKLRGWGDYDGLFSAGNHKWYGYRPGIGSYGFVRVQAWKAESLPEPDLSDVTKVLRANTSKASDSFYELEHTLGEHPGIVIVRGKMEYNGSIFYADGVGSALNVFSKKDDKTNAFMVYGFSDSKIRVWVDSSINGEIFDGTVHTKFDFAVSEAVVEIFAWKLSTITPFFTLMFPLDDDKMPPAFKYMINYDLSDGLTLVMAQITDASSQNKDFRFPSSSFIADRHDYRENSTKKCMYGGFTVIYEKGYMPFSPSLFERKLELYKPINYKHPHEDFGALLCLPDSFGGGSFTESAFNAVGILHSWINGDCGIPPEKKNGYINTSVNGTEFGARATLECNEGYVLTNDIQPYCFRDGTWNDYVSCRPVECGEVEAPTNGSMNVSGLTFGNKATFECDEGYKVNGSSAIECLSSGNWSASVPTCKIDDVDDDGDKVSRSDKGSAGIVGCLLAFAISTMLTLINSGCI